MAANVSLLSDMSDKLTDYCRTYFKLDDRQLSSEEMGEFYYAFNKANAFSSATPRESSRPSHRDFVKLLNAYEKFAHAADEYRLSGKSDPAVLATLALAARPGPPPGRQSHRRSEERARLITRAALNPSSDCRSGPGMRPRSPGGA